MVTNLKRCAQIQMGNPATEDDQREANQDRSQSCSSCPLCNFSDGGGIGIEIVVSWNPWADWPIETDPH